MTRKKINWQTVNGVLFLDKPVGASSNHILQQVRRLFRAQKAGHTGALDPLASGVLPLCFGEATKFSQHLLDASKQYDVTMQLGVRTTTSDAEGEVTQTRVVQNYTSAQLEAVLHSFRGQIEQVPTMYSALKYQGRPYYEYARKGETIPRKARPITIHELAVCEQRQDSMDLHVHCSKGTYIRTLVDDIGEALGCGAHVTALRRTDVAQFSLSQCVDVPTLEAMLEAERMTYLQPVDCFLAEIPILSLQPQLAKALLQGKPVNVLEMPAQYRVYCGQQFIGLGQVTGGVLTSTRLLNPESLDIL